jgi:hypothetical protein
VAGTRIAQMAARIDRRLVLLGKRCCAMRSQRRLERAKLRTR